jgi:hypothetical protein
MSSQLNPRLGTRDASAILEPAYARKIGEPRGEGERVAIIVNHGMGQQVPYETIEGVAKGVWRGVQNPKNGLTSPRSLIRRVRLGTQGKDEVETELVRAEIQIQHGQQTFDVHIYEAYWAPLTEGKVALKDVMAFLFSAGSNGFMNTEYGKYRRWMFGSEYEFKLPKLRLMAILLFLMLLLLALLFMNAVLVAAATSHAIGGSDTFPGKLTVPLTSDFIAADLAVVLVSFGTVGLWVFKKLRSGTSTPRWLSWLGWILIVPGAALVVLAGWFIPFQLPGCHPECFVWPHVSAWAAHLAHECRLPGILSCLHRICITLFWGFELLAAYTARWFLVEYVGDVPAYIAAHTVSKFYDLRQQIWQTAMKVSRAVYRAQADGRSDANDSKFLYNKVIMVGHSLGSVIAYDVLNGLLLEQAFSNHPLQVAQRTRMFLTFGSPLDKTAFLFRTQADMRSPVREVAAAAVQPMIQNYNNRPKEWVNLYSKSDIISGALDYYDSPDKHNAKGEVQLQNPPGPPEMLKPVNNIPDPDARTPLAAHVEYWTGELFARELFRGITT